MSRRSETSGLAGRGGVAFAAGSPGVSEHGRGRETPRLKTPRSESNGCDIPVGRDLRARRMKKTRRRPERKGARHRFARFSDPRPSSPNHPTEKGCLCVQPGLCVSRSCAAGAAPRQTDAEWGKPRAPLEHRGQNIRSAGRLDRGRKRRRSESIPDAALNPPLREAVCAASVFGRDSGFLPPVRAARRSAPTILAGRNPVGRDLRARRMKKTRRRPKRKGARHRFARFSDHRPSFTESSNGGRVPWRCAGTLRFSFLRGGGPRAGFHNFTCIPHSTSHLPPFVRSHITG